MSIADTSLVLFGLFNLLRVVSYVPQIVRIARDRHGATSISYACWSIWIGANASTAAYAVINIADPWLFLISAFNALCCFVVVALTAWKRRRWTAQLNLREG